MHSILIVDGSAVIRDTVIRHLQRGGFETHAASDGEEAVELLQCVGVDAIVLDVVLKRPGDGIELLHTIRRDDYFKLYPVIVYTLRENQREIEQARACGVFAVLDKTLDDLAELTRQVNKAVSTGGQGVASSEC